MSGQCRAPIAEAMQAYAADGALAFHTPGHKQGKGAHSLLHRLITAEGLHEEVSLMEELDDLSAPSMCIAEAERLFAELYGADEALFSVNGTTGAIHGMLLGTLSPGDAVLVPRNAHRSIWGGIILAGAMPVFLQPEIDTIYGIALGISEKTVAKAIAAHPEARALVMTYPTYYGVAQDLAAIVRLAHRHGLLVLVDEAHGPHLRFSDALPPQALDCGADIVAQSTHKILGSMTQTSVLLLRGGNRVDRAKLRAAMGLLMSTSPNQLLLASLDIARLQMAEDGERLIGHAAGLANSLRKAIHAVAGLHCLTEEELPRGVRLDATKLTVSVRELGICGSEAEKILRQEYKIGCELADAANVLFLISYADAEREAAALLAALRGMAERHQGKAPLAIAAPLPEAGKLRLPPREAFFAPREHVPFADAAGHVSAEQVMFYPPGVPVLVPGEEVTADVIRYVRAGQRAGLKLVGPQDAGLEYLQVIAQKNGERQDGDRR